MDKTELIRELYTRLDKKVPMKTLDSVLDCTLQIISERLKKGEVVNLADFGTFAIADKVIKKIKV